MKPKKESTHLLIWKNPIFLLLSFANFFAEWGLFVPLTYLPDAAVVKDISPEDANYLISAFGEYIKGFDSSLFYCSIILNPKKLFQNYTDARINFCFGSSGPCKVNWVFENDRQNYF